MKPESLIHIKIEYDEGKASKKDVLYTEMNLLKLLRHLRVYKELREKELETKNELRKEIKSILTNINKLQRALPQIEEPKEVHKKIKQEPISTKTTIKYDKNLESELEEIQKKLKSLTQ